MTERLWWETFGSDTMKDWILYALASTATPTFSSDGDRLCLKSVTLNSWQLTLARCHQMRCAPKISVDYIALLPDIASLQQDIDGYFARCALVLTNSSSTQANETTFVVAVCTQQIPFLFHQLWG